MAVLCEWKAYANHPPQSHVLFSAEEARWAVTRGWRAKIFQHFSVRHTSCTMEMLLHLRSLIFEQALGIGNTVSKQNRLPNLRIISNLRVHARANTQIFIRTYTHTFAPIAGVYRKHTTWPLRFVEITNLVLPVFEKFECRTKMISCHISIFLHHVVSIGIRCYDFFSFVERDTIYTVLMSANSFHLALKGTQYHIVFLPFISHRLVSHLGSILWAI